MNKSIELVGKTLEAYACGLGPNKGESTKDAQERIEKRIAEVGGVQYLPEDLRDDVVFIMAESRDGDDLSQTLTVDKSNPHLFASDGVVSNKSQGRLTNHFWLAKEYETALLSVKSESPSFNQAELARHYEEGGTKGQIRAYEIAKQMNKMIKQNKATRIYH